MGDEVLQLAAGSLTVPDPLENPSLLHWEVANERVRCADQCNPPQARPPSAVRGPLALVQAAIAYYGTYTAEIDQQIEANEQETAEAHAAYLAGQAAVRR